MILDKLKELEVNDQLDIEHLKEFNTQELIDEIKLVYNKNSSIDWSLYAAIPQVIVDNLVNATKEDYYLINNIFYEQELLQIMYMQTKGLDKLYSKILIAMCNPAQVCNEFESLLNNEKEYIYLNEMYSKYCLRSNSLIGQQLKLMQSLNNVSIEDFNNIMKGLKEITKQEE